MFVKFQNKWLTLVNAIFFTLLGVNFFIKPAVAFDRLGILFGLVLGVIGIVQLASFFIGLFQNRKSPDMPPLLHLLIGLITITFGVILATNANVVIMTVQTAFGLYALLIGIVKLVVAIQYKLDGEPTWISELLASILSIGFATFILLFSKLSVYVIAILTGIYLVLYGFYCFSSFIVLVRR